eukprot:NODE_10504_length_589_cov_85.738197_g10227_i0.p2 GENE.NODE_10504_length_589_cov_85.738197_g10227_i0~~NODE_10504_length_589_cov_85.738197_g10227_i0.p2  ORF type:complete len:128 (+),score=23.77 NODE_10504_length_589_cov_85.738197_g10227_i0:45-386(+)
MANIIIVHPQCNERILVLGTRLHALDRWWRIRHHDNTAKDDGVGDVDAFTLLRPQVQVSHVPFFDDSFESPHSNSLPMLEGSLERQRYASSQIRPNVLTSKTYGRPSDPSSGQ